MNISNYEVTNTKNNSILKTNEDLDCWYLFIGITNNFEEDDICYNFTIDKAICVLWFKYKIIMFYPIVEQPMDFMFEKAAYKFIGIANDNFIFAIFIQLYYD
ncbi:MAG: hypothetical protein MUO82_04065 [Candidatus Thermoplasmatota archaeon]|nr:hypothetical protein [Candidatus Thermoplasmatota archaeon]